MSESTTEIAARLYAYLKAHPYGEQDDNGVDISLLRANRKLTPKERLDKHQATLNNLEKMRNAAARHRAVSRHPSLP
jgi:hypothetical protein